MMKTIQLLAGVLCICLATVGYSQRTYDIRFAVDEVDCVNRTVCVLTQLRSPDGFPWNLAGQNYRIFYDGSKADYITGSGESMLPVSQYSQFPDSFQDIQNQDASQLSTILPFAESLSFLNYSIDLMNLSTGGINIPGNGEWVSTTKLCFEVTQEVIDDPSECLNIVWARMGLTDIYATAFVEIAEWVSANTTTEAFANVYDDLGPEDGNEACITAACDGADSETSMTACSDGIDNDLDGLVDCDDPSCEVVEPCFVDRKEFTLDLKLGDGGIDCVTGNVCYDIELLASGDAFVLGTQEYRLYYSSARGSFLSAQSLLGSEFQAVSLQGGTPRENVDATGTGSLPYESDLGFIDFVIQLNNSAEGSNIMINPGELTPIAQICFTMNQSTINDDALCFEATWARAGVTDAYGDDFVEINEWVDASTSVIAEGTEYEDLSPDDGDSACFNTTCGSGETSEIDCSDNQDNDNDGLIDCQDPGCSATVFCMQSCDALAPTLGRN
ncbi:MAG: hypothetical protein AAFQ02_00375 [Bacteroidota bacterium]